MLPCMVYVHVATDAQGRLMLASTVAVVHAYIRIRNTFMISHAQPKLPLRKGMKLLASAAAFLWYTNIHA